MYTLNSFQKRYKHKISLGLSLCPIDSFENYEYKLDMLVNLKKYNCFLQRPYVWSEMQKNSYILSLLRGVPQLPFTVVAEIHGNTTIFKVIDGKQRLSTILSFLNNEFPIIWDYKSIYCRDLSEDCINEIRNSSYFRWNIHYSYQHEGYIDDDTLISLFEELNFTGTAVEYEHIENLKKIQNGF